MAEDITLETLGPVALITLNRPQVMNSLDFAANNCLIRIWERFIADSTLRVAVLTGAGPQAFCAGADLKTYTMAYATTPAPAFRQRYTEGPGFGGITRNLQINKPILAAINGYAISGGLELALACDIRFCAPHAEFGLQDVQWGFHACDGGLIRLKDIIGLGRAMEMILSGQRIDAARALEIGLVNRIVPVGELLPVAIDYAQMLASRAPLAQQLAKHVMARAAGLPLEAALRLESMSFHQLGQTYDLAEGTAAFREKRPARFEGR